MHNQQWDDIKVDKFNTLRKIDMDNLSKSDLAAQESMIQSGIKNQRKQKEILSSGNNFKQKTKEPGDKLYGFGSSGYTPKSKSVYWMDETGYQDVKSKYYKNGQWDRQSVKNYLALPCKNKADALDRVEVAEKQVVLESEIGKATEKVRYIRGTETISVEKTMTGGGNQITPDINKLSETTRLW